MDTFWVCEAHPGLPFDFGPSPRGCKCGAPGMPCPDCNRSAGPDEPPKMPPGVKVTLDNKGPETDRRQLSV
jgi:hypothetical protein